MESQIIKGIIYSNLDEEIGPNSKACIPLNFPQMNLLHVSVKTFAILSGERGIIPDSLVILPFPSLELKGLVKYIQWEDSERRGNVGHSNIALLFDEESDVIFYKYIKELAIPFNDIVQNIIFLEQSKASKEDFINELMNLKTAINEYFEEFKARELQSRVETLPEFKDRSLIDYQFKITVVGDPTVGKTSLILKYTDNAFRRSYVSTLGVHVSNKVFKTEDATIIQLVLWDVGGQKKFEHMRKRFYKGTDAVFLVFDLTNPDSFINITTWYSDIQKKLKIGDDELIGFIIGNKRDLAEERTIKSETAEKLAATLNLKYLETSALSGENVDLAFSTITDMLFKTRI